MRTTPTFSPCCQKSRRGFAQNLANYPDFSATRLFIHQPTGISLSFLWEGQAGGILKWNWMKLLFVPCSSSWPAVPITPICCRRRVSIFCHKSTLIIVTICLKIFQNGNKGKLYSWISTLNIWTLLCNFGRKFLFANLRHNLKLLMSCFWTRLENLAPHVVIHSIQYSTCIYI